MTTAKPPAAPAPAAPAPAAGVAVAPTPLAPGASPVGVPPMGPSAPVPPPDPPPEPTRMVKITDRDKKVRVRRTVQAELIVKRKGIPAAPLSLNKPRTIIGRDRDACDVVIDEEDTSRQHASITKEQTGFYVLHDLGSTNGVTVGGRKVDRRTLIDGDVFAIGGTSFTFKVIPGPAADKK